MTNAELLVILKTAIGEPNASADREAFISFQLSSAIQRLTENGVDLSTTGDYPQEDAELIIPYAEFLIVKRDTQEGLPRYLEWAIHNRLMIQVAERGLDV